MSDRAPVVSNAGPLIALAKLNVLHLLKELYGRIFFTQSVFDEIVTDGVRHGYEDARRLHLFFDQATWTSTQVHSADVPAELSKAPLDHGERDTLALAVLLNSELVLIDETVGRQMARSLRIRVRGSLGILIEAYHRHLLGSEQLRLYFAEMIGRQDIWINRGLAERLLRETLGE